MTVPAIEWSPLSPKCAAAAAGCDSFINILEGAVRSSKTVAAALAWLTFLQQSEHREFLMTGKTVDTLYRNVIDGNTGLLNLLGRNRARYVAGGIGGAQLHLHVGGKPRTCYCIGTADESAEGRIRGLTVGGWLADEISLTPKSATVQALNRMSLAKARAIWTTNPDSPFHYIKTDFIDVAEERGYAHYHFELGDNWSLTEEFKNNLMAAYKGLWYKRSIQGLWVLAEGAIYDMFNDKVHVITQAQVPATFNEFFVGADYATGNPTAFLLCGRAINKVYVLKEYYWDSAVTMRQKTDAMYSADFKEFVSGTHYGGVAVDPTAASFILQLRNDGAIVRQANNSVLDGIRRVSTLLGNDRLFIVGSGCPNLCKEFTSYVWDPKKQLVGEDKPIKQFDHALDSLRYAIYTFYRND